MRTKIHGGINDSFRDGDTFIKYTEHPHVEEAAFRFLAHLGVPHIPVTAHGDHVRAPWFHGVPLIQATRGDLRQLHQNRQHAADTLFAEWLGGIGDRHSMNYMLSPTGVPHSIDHGIAFNWHEDPHASELMQVMDRPTSQNWGHPRFGETVISPHVLAAAVHPDVLTPFKQGLGHLEEDQQQLALHQFHQRLAHVEPGMRVAGMIAAHDAVS